MRAPICMLMRVSSFHNFLLVMAVIIAAKQLSQSTFAFVLPLKREREKKIALILFLIIHLYGFLFFFCRSVFSVSLECLCFERQAGNFKAGALAFKIQ